MPFRDQQAYFMFFRVSILYMQSTMAEAIYENAIFPTSLNSAESWMISSMYLIKASFVSKLSLLNLKNDRTLQLGTHTLRLIQLL